VKIRKLCGRKAQINFRMVVVLDSFLLVLIKTILPFDKISFVSMADQERSADAACTMISLTVTYTSPPFGGSGCLSSVMRAEKQSGHSADVSAKSKYGIGF
jgi:hypothetical protein